MSVRTISMFIFSVCIAFSAQAQWGAYRSFGPEAGKTNPFRRTKFSIDTISYMGEKIARKRAAKADLEKQLRSVERASVTELMLLQDALDNHDGPSAQQSIDRLANMTRGFDLAPFQAEADQYTALAGKRAALDDSLKQARENEEKKQTAGQQHIQDSINNIISSYGSLNEYNYQKSLRAQSKHGYKILYTGYKSTWYFMLPVYMGTLMGCNAENDNGDLNTSSDESGRWILVTINCGGKAVYVKTLVDNAPDNIPVITEVDITGDAASLAALFLGYWENSSIPKSSLKKGAVVSQDFLSDHITFNWKGASPILTIVPNPKYKGK